MRDLIWLVLPVLTGIWMVAGIPVSAEESGDTVPEVLSQRLSLAEAVDIALVHNRNVQSIQVEKRVAEGQIAEAYGYVFPYVTLEGMYTRLDEVPSFEFEEV